MNAIRVPCMIGLVMAALVSSIRAEEENKAVKKDVDQLQGEWTIVSGSADGQELPPDLVKQMKRICKGDETLVMLAEEVFFKAKFTVDPSKKPKTIDYQVTDGPTKGTKQLGIYELDGDTFKACFAKPDGERPTDFKPGDGRTVSVWKCANPAKAKDAK